ncbi:MFS transporter [Nannocystis punicea]|uniref:MFS transporter n=1 Tax=Nannocystis punicea TaxID=2995304 RepID=A0ABY7GUQ3_9BACT|nr:MFS transporter [Nannocystis poenicansa]WAS90682.1 MFS transporter [Nannocystis poenicansa]
MATTPPADPPTSSAAAPPSAWAPLRQRVFRSLWLGALSSNIALWVQNAVGSWDMTSLATAPIYVALLQTMSGAPVLLVGLPAAAFADLFDRRRLLVVFAGWMAAVSIALALLSFTGALGPVALLALTFALGLGAALSAPLWQSVLPSQVAAGELASAVTLGGVAVNLARAIGPAIGGVGVALAGSGAVYTFNACAFLIVVVQVLRWRPARERPPQSPERVVGAIVAGLRFAGHAPVLRAVIARAGAFIVCGSALWALLPVIARRELHMSPLRFGALLGCVGAGALLGAAVMPRLRARWGPDRLTAAASLVYAATMLALGYVRSEPALYLAMLATGVAWISIMSSLNVAAASAAPGWVHARALGFYLLVFQGGLALGSLAWGGLAGRLGPPTTLAIAAAGVALGALATARWRLGDARREAVAPWSAWPEPVVVGPDLDHEAGPVLIVRRHRVPANHRAEFLQLCRELEHLRRRDGASDWSIYEDLATPDLFVETFALGAWSEHLRQHGRAVVSDQPLLARLAAVSEDAGVVHLVDARALAAARTRGAHLHAPNPEPP